jgi:alpha-tubulin suppressor-like RCC1 family protein
VRAALVIAAIAGCQRLVSVDADPSVAWIAAVTVDEDGAPIAASGVLAFDAPLPRQSSDAKTLLFGFTADQIDASADLDAPVRFAMPCDAALIPVWAAEGDRTVYREVAPSEVPALTAPWLGDKCPADRVCLEGECVDAVVDIDAGTYYACARWASGRVSCWGLNVFGMLGQSELDVFLQTEAREIAGIDDAVGISTGEDQACAIRRGGRVSCWGRDLQGELLGTQAPVGGVPRAISGIENASDLSASWIHDCAVDGANVKCWGFGEDGQLGDPSVESSGLPVTALGVSEPVEVDTGDRHSCARSSEGRVLCWGSNEFGQLGPGSGSVVEVVAKGAVAVDLGANSGCAILEEGDVNCWGEDNFDQLGGGVPQLSGRALAIDIGLQHGCAIVEGAGIECWGSTIYAQLGRIETYPFFLGIPVPAPTEGPNLDVAAGDVFTCALAADRRVSCWGANQYAELGNGRHGNVLDRQVALEGRALKIGAGDDMTCALLEDRGVRCWGRNDEGQLGRGDRTALEAPARVELPSLAIDVEAGASHACAILEIGDVYCWGRNNVLQAGPGGPDVIDTPMFVIGGAVDLALGDFHSCAVLGTGEVACWGLNSDRAPVGHGNLNEAQPIDLVPGVLDAVAGDAGLDQTCVIRGDRTVTCWGRDSQEEELANVDEVRVGRRHSCAISGARVFCWGDNDHGQLGDGTFVPHSRPLPVLEVSDARRLAMGSSHVCAVAGATGELWCWGDNFAAQLNDGNWPNDRAAPARVEGLSGVLFGDGFRHACVSIERGAIECWGWNEWGQVNFSTAAIEAAPSIVLGLEPL